jgi:hypothetical protein
VTGLEKGTIDFIGHALALYDNDTYQSQPAIDLVDRCKVLTLISSSSILITEFLFVLLVLSDHEFCRNGQPHIHRSSALWRVPRQVPDSLFLLYSEEAVLTACSGTGSRPTSTRSMVSESCRRRLHASPPVSSLALAARYSLHLPACFLGHFDQGEACVALLL